MNKKILSLLLAVFMIVGILAPMAAFAGSGTEPGTEDNVTGKTKTVTLHKLLLTAEELKAWDENGPVSTDGTKRYDGTQNLAGLNEITGKTLKEIKGVYFAWTNADGKYIDAAGNPVQVNADGTATGTHHDITPDDPAFKNLVLGGETGDGGILFHTWKLEGKFKIQEIKDLSTTSHSLTGSKAVPVEIELPLQNESGVVVDAHVYPKNIEEKPEIDKNFFKDEDGGIDQNAIDAAIASGEITAEQLGADYKNYQAAKQTISAKIGDIIPYEVKTKFPAKTHFKFATWSDRMDPGLTYNKGSLKVQIGAVGGPYTDVDATNYTLKENLSGFELDLESGGLALINDQTEVKEIRLTYSATVNSDAVVDKPQENDIILQTGNNKTENKESEPFKPTTTTLKVEKKWAGATVGAPVDTVFDLYERPEGGTDGDWKLVDSITIAKGKTTADRDFTGLATSGKEYKVVERPNGYIPTYTVDTATGKVTIDNTKDDDNPEPLNPTDPKVEVYGKKFVKTDDNATTPERLQGAEFVVRDGKGDDAKYLVRKSDATLKGDTAAYEAAQAAYLQAIKDLEVELNKATPDPTAVSNLQDIVNTAKDTRDKAYKAMKYQYAWESAKADGALPDGVVTLISDDQGRFEIEGLAKGTYYLEETKAPAKFAKLSGRIEFVVGPGSYDGSAEEIQYNKDNKEDGYGQQVVNKKTTIPQTGGIGTIIFTVVGLSIMSVAVLSLRKRKTTESR